MTVVQAATLFAKTPTLYYAFFSVIEIATTVVIVWSAWRWSAEPERTPVRVGPASARI